MTASRRIEIRRTEPFIHVSRGASSWMFPTRRVLSGIEAGDLRHLLTAYQEGLTAMPNLLLAGLDEAERDFRDHLTPEMWVAWDRDVPQEHVGTSHAPRLYGVTVFLGDPYGQIYIYRWTGERWVVD